MDTLKKVAESAVQEFIVKNQHVPELAVAAAVQDRLNELLNDTSPTIDRSSMASEARRRETFSRWPHMDYKWALPDQMAQAGFYHQPNTSGDDRAMCFTCTVCLVCWEKTDEPWSEHERHSPNCPFVMGEYTQNVPLSVTYATAPAVDATYRGSPVSQVGSSGVNNLIATSNSDGLITIYDISGKIKRTHSFYVTQYDSPILECCVQEFGRNSTWTGSEQNKNVTITALSIIGKEKTPVHSQLNRKTGSTKDAVSREQKFEESSSTETKTDNIRPGVICGLSIKSATEADVENVKNFLCLVVYDFQYSKDVERESLSNNKNTKPDLMSNIVMSMINDIDYSLMDVSNCSEEMSYINDVNFQALKMIKDTETNNYQNLIPGESDKIFLPPLPKLVDEQEDVDAASTLLSDNYSFINGPVNPEPINAVEKSISDHITDLKNSKSKKLNYSHAVQCVALPQKYKNQSDLEVFEIIPTIDKNHILVMLRSLSGNGVNVFLVYAINFTGPVVKLDERPVIVQELPSSQRPVEVSIIPSVDKLNNVQYPESTTLEGSCVIVCSDGVVRIFDLVSMKLSIVKLDSTSFISAVYCNSLERLCAATSDGSLHFYGLNDVDSDSMDDHDDEDYLTAESSGSVPVKTDSVPFEINMDALSVDDLRHLNALCTFEPLSAAYCVVVPPCWSEMQQVQRQRRHPQYVSGDEQHTRTWRLQTDSTTWDEHIFELTLPWPVCIGHMDIHFSLHGQHLSPPHVEITLLRQNTAGIGHHIFQVDDGLSFDFLQRNQNPVTSQEYLRSHNAEILAGPINIVDCVDLSDQNGSVILTSPKLFKSNTRTLLLHIKALCDPSKEHSSRKEYKRNHNESTNTTNGTSSNAKGEYYMGCDCLHELSITIYKTKHVDSFKEKIQRYTMLESNLFFAKLLSCVVTSDSIQYQSIVFDILVWIVSIRLARNRTSTGEASYQQIECVKTVETFLESLCRNCLLLRGRSIARKCVKFIIICSNGARNINEATGQQFDGKVLQALLQCLPDICAIWSAGSLHWLVVLILKVSRENAQTSLANQCIVLLCQIATEIQNRTNPYHLLLRSRFGLFSTPLEPELFDIDPPAPAKSSSIPVTYASVVNSDQTTSQTVSSNFVLINESSLDPKEVFVSPSNDTKLKLKSMVPNKHMRGLLETEPLHFVCIAASDGTRVERFDLTVPPVNISGLYGNHMPVQTAYSQQTTGTKKVPDSDDAKDKENIGIAEFDITLEPVNSAIELECKKITKLLLNSQEKAAADSWSAQLSGKLDGFEMTIDDPDIICITKDEYNNSNNNNVPKDEWNRNEPIELLNPHLGKCSLQQLLVAPPQQVMVVERMQSGARRFVTLDFGAPVLLTDVIIPSCHDLVSLSLDLWLKGEEVDIERLVLSTDIGNKTLVLNDLQPPPICRFVKITTIGRYGMSTTRCKIPIGNFYGHIIILPDEVNDANGAIMNAIANISDIDNQINVLSMLMEDVSCRYSLACSKLKDLLHPLLTSDIPNSVHMASYMSILRDSNDQGVFSSENIKVFSAYQEALMYQRQLNIIQGVIYRTENFRKGNKPHQIKKGLNDSCTDKLRSISESLLDVLLSLPVDIPSTIDKQSCQKLFQGLCVSQGPRVQMLTATLLVKCCGKQAYWGDFIADTLSRMFSTNYTLQFPQDRVFVLLSYLGRKSPERGIVLDATLRVLAEVLAPLSLPNGPLLAVSTDLSLLGWILLYLSQQLDTSNKSESQTGKRWNWVTGDNNSKISGNNVYTGSNRRKAHRRFIQYKQHIDQLDWTKKVSTQVQALSALSSQAATLSSKLEAALKQQENVFKRIKQISSKQKESIKQSLSGSSKDHRILSSWDQMDTSSNVVEHLTNALNAEHCLAVSRGIVNLLLAMDHSCSSDMFLLACKVLARLVMISQLAISQLFTLQQLEQLMKVFVRGDQPWIQHALACLLQDMLDVTINSITHQHTMLNTPVPDEAYESTSNTNNEMDTDSQPAGTSWSLDNEICETFSIEEILVPDKDAQNKTNNNNHLPSVFESDDSELDDFLDDILERGRSLLRRSGTTKTTVSNGSISSAMDARLELGVETTAEIQLRRLTNLATSNLLQYLTNPITESENSQASSPWPNELLQPWIGFKTADMSNGEMLTVCFNNLFHEMQLQSATYIENTLRLWLTLNKSSIKSNFNPSFVPLISVSSQSVTSLVTALVYAPNLSIRTWCIALQALTLMCNMSNNVSAAVDWLEMSINGMAGCLINHQEFVPMLFRLLSGSGLSFSDKYNQAGPSVCKALHDFLVRLQMRCDVITSGSSSGVQLKEILLRLLYQMVQPSGPLALRQGPLDVQCKYLQTILHLHYNDTNLSIVMCIMESTSVLVNGYVSNIERIKCVNLGERSGNSGNNFSGLFASVLGSDSSKQDRPASWESLLIALLKFLTKLVQTPLGESVEPMDTETVTQNAQTDECKAEQQERTRETSNRVPCLADTVLQHHPSIMVLCHALATCSGSSLAMLVGCAQQIGLTDIGEPITVGDAVFQLLSIMIQKSSKPALILEPLILFLRSTQQLSEPLLWYLLQVLNNEEILKQFVNLGGVRVLAESMVQSGKTLSPVHHGTVSLVMHHMAATVNVPTSSNKSDATVTYAGPSVNKKIQQASMENAEALVNFAPMGSIRCHSGTAQPADILIQSTVAPHRRARTPQWCYHFYPDETHTDLTIRLPCAVLLREVQLQPHISSLSTCPSAVALEISSGNPDHLVPACPPLPTSGMTFIRLHLPTPEVVTNVLLRLYKPRDASNIGLSQIRLLGTSAFGGIVKPSTNDVSEEETFSKFSLGWLRLLHHCFILPESNSVLEKETIASAANVPDLLVTCCGLLLVPTHIPTLYLPNLERVLCKLSLFDRQSGLSAIRLLLRSKSALLGSTHVKPDLAMNSLATQSVCELLYQICEHQDDDTPYRVSAVLEWLLSTATQAVSSTDYDTCSSAFIFCISSILWSAKTGNVLYPLQNMITTELFNTIFRWTELAQNNLALKNALDSLLCSLCYIKTELFPILLQRMQVFIPNLSTDLTASISDDRKDSESMTDDSKQSFENETEWYGRVVVVNLQQLFLTKSQLETIATVSRSPAVIQQLLDSGLPKLLIRAILHFCDKFDVVPMANLESVTSVLNFFADLCSEPSMRDWLGSTDGSSFWSPLLQWLCCRQTCFSSKLKTEAHTNLEDVCVKFLSKCCLCHVANQKLLAKVLCDVISQQVNGISGFMRRLVLQLLLENEKIPICIKTDESVYKISPIPQPSMPFHPAYKCTHDRVFLYLNTNITIGEILESHIAFATSIKSDPKKKDNFGITISSNGSQTEVWEIGLDGSDHISMAAGVTAKDKRAKDAKNHTISIISPAKDSKTFSLTPQSKKKRYNTSEGVVGFLDSVCGRTVKCELLPEYSLPLGLTLAQLLALLETQPQWPDKPCVHLTITHSKDDRAMTNADALLQHSSIGNCLQVFSAIGGLALLAQHLPMVYPEVVRPSSSEKPVSSEQPDTDWVKVDGSDDIYEDLEDIQSTSTPSKNTNGLTNVPPHSLTAFGLFLRLPGYAEVLLKDSKKALCLLRLVLGVTDDGEGGDVFLSPVADSLPTLPFEVLRQLYDTTPLGTDDGRLLRSISISIGVTHLLLSCLAIFTHQVQPHNGSNDSAREPSNSNGKADEKCQLYWAKGTGFGTGSTQQSWNVEQALLRQRSEEEHVTVLLQVLASYINPGGRETDDSPDNKVLPPGFEQQLGNSCLLPALSSYLRNDSGNDQIKGKLKFIITCRFISSIGHGTSYSIVQSRSAITPGHRPQSTISNITSTQSTNE